MIVNSPDIPIATGQRYNIPSAINPMTGQPWTLELSNYSPENLLVMSPYGTLQILPYTTDAVISEDGEIGPYNISFSVSDPASGVPSPITTPYYVSIRWATWPNMFNRVYPVKLSPMITPTTAPTVLKLASKQSTIVAQNGGATIALAYGGAVTVGSTLVASVITQPGPISGITDNLNGAWTLLATRPMPALPGVLSMYAVPNAIAGATTVTAAIAAGGASAMAIAEYANMPTTLNKLASKSNVDSGAGSPSSGAIVVPSTALLIGSAGDPAGGNITYTPPGGWTLRSQTTGVIADLILADNGIPTGVPSGSYSFTVVSGPIVAGFEAAMIVALAAV